MAVSRYYKFPGDPRYYTSEWDGMGVPSNRASETRAISNYVQAGDWPPLRRSGPEPLSFFGTMSDNEKRLALLGAAALFGWYFFIKKPKRGRRTGIRRRLRRRRN